jgi:hypothetical protein
MSRPPQPPRIYWGSRKIHVFSWDVKFYSQKRQQPYVRRGASPSRCSYVFWATGQLRSSVGHLDTVFLGFPWCRYDPTRMKVRPIEWPYVVASNDELKNLLSISGGRARSQKDKQLWPPYSAFIFFLYKERLGMKRSTDKDTRLTEFAPKLLQIDEDLGRIYFGWKSNKCWGSKFGFRGVSAAARVLSHCYVAPVLSTIFRGLSALRGGIGSGG